jgi:hypothetical protein
MTTSMDWSVEKITRIRPAASALVSKRATRV